jgi:phage tail P2-like protein
MFKSALPPNATRLERAIEKVVGDRYDAIDMEISATWNPDTCPEHLLPWLAWALQVDNWESHWPESVKRSVIAQSLKIRRLKGTLGGVQEALKALGVNALIREWWQRTIEEGEAPKYHTFDVYAWANDNRLTGTDSRLTEEIYTLVKRAVETTKPARSHFEFHIGAQFAAHMSMAATMRLTKIMRLSMTITMPTP